jgi:hypothetical protein
MDKLWACLIAPVIEHLCAGQTLLALAAGVQKILLRGVICGVGSWVILGEMGGKRKLSLFARGVGSKASGFAQAFGVGVRLVGDSRSGELLGIVGGGDMECSTVGSVLPGFGISVIDEIPEISKSSSSGVRRGMMDRQLLVGLVHDCSGDEAGERENFNTTSVQR